MDPLLGGALIGGGLDLIGGIIGGIGAADQQGMSQEMAREQMRFQERMSSTAMQRGRADARAAGYNPILSFMQGGASTPGGASGIAQNVLEGASSSARSMAARTLELSRLEQDIKESQSRINLQKAQEDLARINARDISMEFGSRATMQKMDAEMMKHLESWLGSSEALKGAGPVGEVFKHLLPFMLRRKPTERR